MARIRPARIEALLQDPTIVRNRAKVTSTVDNARAFLEVQREHGSFDAFAWSFVGGKPIRRRPRSLKDIPATTPESDALSKDLKRRGFKFVGSTIVYAFMQAVGMVDDHMGACAHAAPPTGRRRGIETRR